MPRKQRLDLGSMPEVRRIIRNALAEDIGSGDITCRAVITRPVKLTAEISVKDRKAVVCGLPLIGLILKERNPRCRVQLFVQEGARLTCPRVIARVSGDAKAVLQAERTILNFLGRLSGIATLTHELVTAAGNGHLKVLDTRKTTPGLRVLEKYAVTVGGGVNHRKGLFDQVLIKDNHIAIANHLTGVRQFAILIETSRKKSPPGTVIEIEVKNSRELRAALLARPDVILLDNMSPQRIRAAVKLRDAIAPRVKLEASGNVSEKNIARIAAAGVDFVSVGKLTHSVRCVDMSLNVTAIE